MVNLFQIHMTFIGTIASATGHTTTDNILEETSMLPILIKNKISHLSCLSLKIVETLMSHICVIFFENQLFAPCFLFFPTGAFSLLSGCYLKKNLEDKKVENH